jgi:hypothetical protein
MVTVYLVLILKFAEGIKVIAVLSSLLEDLVPHLNVPGIGGVI